MLAERGGGSFAVVVVQVNGEVQRQKVVSTLDVSVAGIALLGVDGGLRCRSDYNSSMQVLRRHNLRAIRHSLLLPVPRSRDLTRFPLPGWCIIFKSD